MTAAAKKDTAIEEAVAWENPLIPDKKLRALYVKMVELRLLEEHVERVARRPRGSVPGASRGHEGCRVSTTHDLKRGDLTSDALAGVATGFLRGERLADLVSRVHASGKRMASVGVSAPGQLPVAVPATDGLHLAVGAAWVLKAARRQELVVAYVASGELRLADWKPVLRLAAEQMLPMIFVILPEKTISAKQAGQLSLLAGKCGVPGVPVDAADPVALFRVAQESMLRARAGGGPVLMECIPFQCAGKKPEAADPVRTMREFLLHRKIVNETWCDGVEARFTARLQSLK